MRGHLKDEMAEHQRRAILKAALMVLDPHCVSCGCELIARYGADASAVVVGDVLKCSKCAMARSAVLSITRPAEQGGPMTEPVSQMFSEPVSRVDEAVAEPVRRLPAMLRKSINKTLAMKDAKRRPSTQRLIDNRDQRASHLDPDAAGCGRCPACNKFIGNRLACPGHMVRAIRLLMPTG